MESVLNILNTFIGYLTSLGGAGILAFMMLILGLIVRLGFGRSLRAAITAAIGFIGLNLATDTLIAYVAPVVMGISENLGIDRPIMDIGVIITDSWAAPLTGLVLVFGVLLNILLYATKFTKTFHIDFWNYWHFAGCTAIVFAATRNVLIAIAAGGIFMAIAWKTADWLAPKQQEMFGIEGCSWPTGATIPSALIGVPVIRLCQKTPGLKNMKLDSEKLQNKLGIFGELSVFGFFLGIVLGALATLPVNQIIQTGFYLAAAMILIPKMVGIMMEGLLPITEAAKEFAMKHLKGREVLLGIDASTILGHPSTMTVVMIMTPVAVLLSAVLPGSGVILAASVVALPWAIAPLTAEANGNIVHMLIAAIVCLTVFTYTASFIAPYVTEMLRINGADTGGLVTCMSEASNPLTSIIVWICDLFGLTVV